MFSEQERAKKIRDKQKSTPRHSPQVRRLSERLLAHDLRSDVTAGAEETGPRDLVDVTRLLVEPNVWHLWWWLFCFVLLFRATVAWRGRDNNATKCPFNTHDSLSVHAWYVCNLVLISFVCDGDVV